MRDRPPSLSSATLLLFSAAMALSLTAGAFFFEGGGALIVWALPMMGCLVAGGRELRRWLRQG